MKSIKTTAKAPTHVSRASSDYLTTLRDLLEVLGWELETWSAMVLEAGCQQAWSIHSRARARELITDESNGYWAAFIQSWIRDDEELLAIYPNELLTPTIYISEKQTRFYHENEA